MNLSDRLESFLSAESLALIRLIRAEADHLDLPLYIVGGSVRDLLLDRPIIDFDLTVEGDAAQLAEVILRKYAGKVVFHSRFGTATWTLDETTYRRLNVPMLGPADFPSVLDFISARSETYSQPGALPTVKRSTIDDDLRRRDFTLNAMALRLDGRYWGQLHDPLSGTADLERRLIRIIHNKSFMDDPTRMLRAVRYAERYEFEIEPGTLSLINDQAREILSRLSGERLRHEIDLMFEESNPSVLLHRLAELDLLKPIHLSLEHANFQLPYLDILSAEFGEFTIPDIMTFKRTLGWILWLMPLSEFDVDTISRRLDFPALLTKSTRAASLLLNQLPSLINWSPSQWTFYLDEIPSIAIYAVYLMRKESALRDYLIHWRNIKPTITGDDLKERGLEPGPRYAEILRQLRAAWLDGNVRNEKEEVMLLNTLTQGG
jgi:tRNA nucleotidyltransferase (CCA-adding enzyme)